MKSVIEDLRGELFLLKIWFETMLHSINTFDPARLLDCVIDQIKLHPNKNSLAWWLNVVDFFYVCLFGP